MPLRASTGPCPGALYLLLPLSSSTRVYLTNESVRWRHPVTSKDTSRNVSVRLFAYGTLTHSRYDWVLPWNSASVLLSRSALDSLSLARSLRRISSASCCCVSGAGAIPSSASVRGTVDTPSERLSSSRSANTCRTLRAMRSPLLPLTLPSRRSWWNSGRWYSVCTKTLR